MLHLHEGRCYSANRYSMMSVRIMNITEWLGADMVQSPGGSCSTFLRLWSSFPITACPILSEGALYVELL